MTPPPKSTRYATRPTEGPQSAAAPIAKGTTITASTDARASADEIVCDVAPTGRGAVSAGRREMMAMTMSTAIAATTDTRNGFGAIRMVVLILSRAGRVATEAIGPLIGVADRRQGQLVSPAGNASHPAR